MIDTDIVLSDVSSTMSEKQLPMEWVLAYLSIPLPISKIKFLARAGNNYRHFMRTRDPKFFYQTLEGLPVIEDFSFVRRAYANPKWDKVIAELKPKKVWIVSQDDREVLEAYIDYNQYRFNKLETEVKILDSNHALHENGIYTGEAKLNVTPERLVRYASTYASLGIPFIGDGFIKKIFKKHPELKEHLIEV